MQIQRIQTLFLLIAAILTAIFCFVPYAIYTPAELDPDSMTSAMVKDTPALMVLNLVLVALLFFTIFAFRNLKQQMRLTILAIVLICVSMVTTGFIIYGSLPNAVPVLLGGVSLLVIALVFALLAYRGMSRDRKLLASLDRLR
ncbi:MAG: DUF4293 domain-containing protein [Muribaculaceae bacterium]|nr:DUF4293 domain-containing protein [Muribaculaceae bacterium]